MSSAIRYDAIPREVKYRDALQSSTDHIISTRKVSIVPITGGSGYKPSSQNTFTFYIDDVSAGAALRCKSVHLTCKVKAYKADGATTNTAKFCSSANDLISRCQIRSKKSRVVLADVRAFNVYSNLVDKLTMSDDQKRAQGWSRGFAEETIDTKQHGLYSSAALVATALRAVSHAGQHGVRHHDL